MSTNTVDFKVSFKADIISLNNWNQDSTVGQLKEHLEKETTLPVYSQKLLWKGKVLKDSTQLKELASLQNGKMLLMGSTAAQIAKVNDMDKMREEQKRLSPHIKLKKPVIRQRVETKYTFHKLSVINEFPFPDKAYRLLERLRDDRGIQAIMKDRQWSVGELIELTPFEASILGYNRNAGQLIAVRLRTDDLSGFRHYDSIRKVLLHELTHNVWQEHDDRFHALNRQLNKDVISLDWTAHGGHTLDHNSYYNPQDEEDDDIDHPSYEAGVYRLGGTSDKKSDDIESRRAQLARAAISRLTKKEEKEMDEGCGS